MKAFKVLGNEANFQNTATRRLLECIKGRKLGEGKGKKGLIWETYRWNKHNFQQKIAKNTIFGGCFGAEFFLHDCVEQQREFQFPMP